MAREPEHPEVVAGRRKRTLFLLQLAFVCAASAGISTFVKHRLGPADAAAATVTFAPQGTAPSGKPYARAYAGAPEHSAACDPVLSRVEAALQVEPIGLSPSGEVARFNDAWWSDARVNCAPRPAVWLSWERPALLGGAVDAAAGYAAAVFGADRAAAARDLAEACRLAAASPADDRHGEVAAALYTVSCDQPTTRDGYVISINAAAT